MIQPTDASGHRSRLREKFLRNGFQGFHDYEIIELLLTLATPRRDCKQPAKVLLKTFGSIRGVINAPTAELIKIAGVGEKNIFGFKLGKELTTLLLKEELTTRRQFRSAHDIFDYLSITMRDMRCETFRVLFLNSQNMLLAEEELSRGTVNAAGVYPREIVKQALELDATGVVCAHNHPTGITDPSLQDKEVTKTLVKALHVLRMHLIDHIIIGDNRYYSFAESGLLTTYSSP